MELIAGGAGFSVGKAVSPFWTDISAATSDAPNFTLPTVAAVAETAAAGVGAGAAGRTAGLSAIVAVLVAAIGMLGLAGNSLVVLVTIVDHDLKEHVSNVIIGNLAVTDLGTCLLVVVPAAASLVADTWPLGAALCRFHCGFNYLFIIVSMMSLALISLDRKDAVQEPLRYIQRSRPSRLVVPLLVIWSTGALFAIVPMALDWIHYDYWEAVCAISWFEHRGTVLYVIVAFCVCFLLPAALIVWSNHVIVRTSHRVSVRHGRSTRLSDDGGSGQREQPSARRLYDSLRSRGAHAVRVLRAAPRRRAAASLRRSASLRPPPEAPSSVLRRSRSELRRPARLDVTDLVSGPHNIENMFSEFDAERRRRARRSPGATLSGTSGSRGASDSDAEVPTLHMPAEERRHSRLRPVIDSLRAWRPATEPAGGQEVAAERAEQGKSISSTSESDGEASISPHPAGRGSIAENAAPRGCFSKITVRHVEPYVLTGAPQELPSLSAEIAKSHTTARSAHGESATPTDESGVSAGPRFLRSVSGLLEARCSQGPSRRRKPPLELTQSRSLTTEQERHLVRSHRRILRSIAIVVAIFFICMTPFCVTKLVKIIFLREDLVPGWVNLLASVVQFISSATNPFIYGFFRPDFKRAFKRIYRRVKS